MNNRPIKQPVDPDYGFNSTGPNVVAYHFWIGHRLLNVNTKQILCVRSEHLKEVLEHPEKVLKLIENKHILFFEARLVTPTILETDKTWRPLKDKDFTKDKLKILKDTLYQGKDDKDKPYEIATYDYDKRRMYEEGKQDKASQDDNTQKTSAMKRTLEDPADDENPTKKRKTDQDAAMTTTTQPSDTITPNKTSTQSTDTNSTSTSLLPPSSIHKTNLFFTPTPPIVFQSQQPVLQQQPTQQSLLDEKAKAQLEIKKLDMLIYQFIYQKGLLEQRVKDIDVQLSNKPATPTAGKHN